MGNAIPLALDIDQLALLEFGNVILGFPQTQILTIESLSRINSKRATEKSSGALVHGSSELPIYTFNYDLTLRDQPSNDNRFCIAIKHPDENEYFAVMCDAVNQYVIENDTSIMAMPPIMQNPDSPVIGLLKKDSTLVLIATAESMRSYINSQECNTHGEVEDV